MENINEKNAPAILTEYITLNSPKAVQKEYEVGDNKLSFMIYPYISFKDRMAMIADIVNYSFKEGVTTYDGYFPEVTTFIKGYTLLKYFTDLELPDEVEYVWLVLNTKIYDDVMEIAGKAADEIFITADKKIKAVRDYLVNKSDFNALIKTISDFGENIKDELKDFDLGSIAETIKKLPDGANTENLVKTILELQGQK